MRQISQSKCFEGLQYIFQHESVETKTSMRFSIFLPPAVSHKSVPVFYWLSGLTCTEENFIIKSGMQRFASKLGVAIVSPDTSPRGLNLPGEDESYDFGSGAGFYLDATEVPWSENYRMYSYVSQELPELINKKFPVDSNRVSIFGHSMGGHGALSIALKNPNNYKSVSAFAPICSPINCPWGQKALSNYLGANKQLWREYDSCALIEDRGWNGPELLVDFGNSDEYLKEQLKPELLTAACKGANVELNLRQHDGYDHSYYFISTFIESHFQFHAKHCGINNSAIAETQKI